MRKFLILFLSILFINCENGKVHTFKVADLCNDQNGMPIKLLNSDTVDKYGKEKVFDKKILKSNDSLIISYKIISDCCQKPKENIMINQDEILIKNDFIGKLCDCYCDYLFEYRILYSAAKNKKIEIK